MFGYYLEVTNSFKDMGSGLLYQKTDTDQCRAVHHSPVKRTGGYDPGAEDKLYALEYDRFAEIRNMIAQEVERIQKTARAIAKLDAYLSMALVASRNQYVRAQDQYQRSH